MRLALTLALVITAFIGLPAVADAQTTWYVDAGNTAGPWIGTEQDPFRLIQDGIDSAQLGDLVFVLPGTYVENIDFSGKIIKVKSERGPVYTTIDGGQAGSTVTFAAGENTFSTLDGFTVTNGSALCGGGIFCDNNADPTISNCYVTSNYATGFRSQGAGMCCLDRSDPTVVKCIFIYNTATGGYAQGGGIHCGDGADPRLRYCTVAHNTAQKGGGVSCDQAAPLFTDTIIVDNTATSLGGGLHCHDTDAVFTNCTIHGNTAYLTAGGLNCEGGSNPYITNCILWGDSPNEIHVGTGLGNITHSCVEGSWPGAGNIDSDPLFAEPGNGDYHLTWFSPCRNTGDNAAPGLPDIDIEGDDRIVDNRVDMGADEFHMRLYRLGNVTPGNWISLRTAGKPGQIVTLLEGTGVQYPPATSPFGPNFLLAPVTQYKLGVIPVTGILIVPVTVPSTWVTGQQRPFQALLSDGSSATLTDLMLLKVR